MRQRQRWAVEHWLLVEVQDTSETAEQHWTERQKLRNWAFAKGNRGESIKHDSTRFQNRAKNTGAALNFRIEQHQAMISTPLHEKLRSWEERRETWCQWHLVGASASEGASQGRRRWQHHCSPGLPAASPPFPSSSLVIPPDSLSRASYIGPEFFLTCGALRGSNRAAHDF